jgi:DNA polymerase-3 subunit delta
VRAGSRNFTAAVESLIAAAAPDCRVVIEAGDLKRNAPLRAACERAKNVAAIPCYIDAEKDIARLIDDEMREAGLTITAEARAMLVPLLGGDRLASRSEIRKLTLYARGQKEVGADDVAAVVADASALALDAAIDAAFAGRTGDVEFQFAKARIAGTSPGSIISAALRQVATLHKGRLAVEGGQSTGAAVEGMYVHFRRASLVEAALKTWSSARLERVMNQLAEATLDTRKQPDMSEAIAQRALMSIAVNARRREA